MGVSMQSPGCCYSCLFPSSVDLLDIFCALSLVSFSSALFLVIRYSVLDSLLSTSVSIRARGEVLTP